MSNEDIRRKQLLRKGSERTINNEKQRLKIYLMDQNDNGYHLCAASQAERDDWFEHISASVRKANAKSSHEKEEVEVKSPSEDPKISAIRQFNSSPNKGMNTLVSLQAVGPSPAEIAAFLHEEKMLRKRAIGQFLGDRNELNKNVLVAYLKCFDFTGIEFDEALRYVDRL
jgi:Sec7-like guanine-nucleotide exchange factor